MLGLLGARLEHNHPAGL